MNNDPDKGGFPETTLGGPFTGLAPAASAVFGPLVVTIISSNQKCVLCKDRGDCKLRPNVPF